jgi:hypothetical protein
MFVLELLYIILWAFGVFFLVRILQKPELIYYFPYIMSFGFSIFILPQVYVIYEKKPFFIDDTVRLFLMTLLCWGMSFVGWYTYKPKSFVFKKSFLKDHNENKLSLVACLFVVLGIGFNFVTFQIFKTTEFEGQQATGIVTILAFFAQLLFLGTGLCLALWFKNKKTLVQVFAILGVLYCFYIGVLQGRRQQTLYALFVVGVPLFLSFQIKPSRLLVIASLVGAFLLIPSMDQYRRILKKSDDVSQFFSSVVSEIDYTKNLKDSYINSKSIELINAGYRINHAYRSGEYRTGLDYWNYLVFRFIPSQLLGKEFKQSLMVKGSIFSNPIKYTKQGYNPNYVTGTTETGIGDAFAQFDYFGCLFFFFLGMFMKRMWFTLTETRSPIVQTFYSILLIDCLIALTHGTSFFLPSFFASFMFMYAASLYSRA